MEPEQQPNTCQSSVSRPAEHGRAARIAALLERSPVVLVTWQHAPGWPISYLSENIRQFGYAPEDFYSGRISYIDLVHPDDHQKNAQELEYYLRHGPDTFEQTYRFLHAEGYWIWLEDHTWLIRDQTGAVLEMQGVLIEVSLQKRAELMNAAQVRLMDLAGRCDIPELLQHFLDEAELLTDSSIGFYHFVNEPKGSLDLQAWSSNTRQRMCNMLPDQTHYPVADAGVWADAIRERRTVIHNDYTALPNRRDLPDGHAAVVREMVVPVFREGLIVAILGVGNKHSPYLCADAEAVQKLADFAWEIVARKRSEAALALRTAELEQLVQFDALTGLPNRRLFADRLLQAMVQVSRRRMLLAVAFLDLDGFKQVNDQLGHAVGDQVLCEVAQRLRTALREGDTVARVGGDEFVIILVDLPEREAAEPLLQRILKAASFAVARPESQTQLPLSASVGVTFFPQPKVVDGDHLVREADQAMYHAKLQGKNCCCFAGTG